MIFMHRPLRRGAEPKRYESSWGRWIYRVYFRNENKLYISTYPRCSAFLRFHSAVQWVVLILACACANASPSYHPAHGSEILWDRFGVAHVYAGSVTDMFYGFGWAQARSHGITPA